jgi:hypothetical protein
MGENPFFSKNMYNLLSENLNLISYSFICFFTPFILGHNQLFTGIVVNAALVMAAHDVKGMKLFPLAILPSLGVLSRGIVFGPFTAYLVWMLPFIWLGNLVLVYTIRLMHEKSKVSVWISMPLGAILKTCFLFTAAFIMYNWGILPVIFLTTMGLFQLFTSLVGGAAALGFTAIKHNI